jgi:hypothetical protein
MRRTDFDQFTAKPPRFAKSAKSFCGIVIVYFLLTILVSWRNLGGVAVKAQNNQQCSSQSSFRT